GRATRRYNPSTNTLTMVDIDLSNLPNKVVHEGSLTPTGTPTSAFVTMRQMRGMGIEFASLRKVQMTNIRNVESVLSVNAAVAKGATYDEAVRASKSVEYATTSIE